VTLEQLRTYHKILILGYGLEGHATERFLKKFHPSAEIGIADQKDDPHYLDKQADYDLAIRTPLLRPKNMTIPYTTGTRLFFGCAPHRTIGITGTKGKSTAVSLLYHLLKQVGMKVRLYGNVGDPMINILTDDVDPDTLCILELSNYQLEDCEYSPNIACFLNIYEERHNHDSFEEYFEAKTQITRHQTPEDIFFYNGNFPQIATLAQQTQAQAIDFQSMHVDEMLAGIHLPFYTHTDNLKAVWAICAHEGMKPEDFVKHVQTFTPLNYRLENIGTAEGRIFYNDSASVHPSSTIFALQSIADVDTLIVGGDDRGYDMHELAKELEKRKIPNIICMGETGRMLKDILNEYKDYHPWITTSDSMLAIVDYAFEQTRAGKVCLLSSGAPSYGLFQNLAERGAQFTTYVKNHAQKEKTNSNADDSS